MTIGEKIRAARKRLKLSGPAVASMIGVDPNTLYRWERGEVEPSLARLEQLAEILQLQHDLSPIPITSNDRLQASIDALEDAGGIEPGLLARMIYCAVHDCSPRDANRMVVNLMASGLKADHGRVINIEDAREVLEALKE